MLRTSLNAVADPGFSKGGGDNNWRYMEAHFPCYLHRNHDLCLKIRLNRVAPRPKRLKVNMPLKLSPTFQYERYSQLCIRKLFDCKVKDF